MINIFPLLSYKYKLIPIFISLFLSACGGTSANGVGGTGITQGRVTGFGSMFVNGVKFNTDNASFTRDEVSSKKQEDFKTGEIVTIKGTVDEGRKTGIATEVIFSDTLEGTVTSLPTTNSIGILGQNITTNNLTIFHGFNKLSDLKLGNIVEVSGFNSQNKITASSIQLIDTSFTVGSKLEIEGEISDLKRDSLTFKINDLIIDYSNANFFDTTEDIIVNGDFLVVNSNQDIENNILRAANIQSVSNNLEPNTYYEIEGFITEFDSINNFTIDDEHTITTNNNTVITNGELNDLEFNQFIIAIGNTNAEGILITEEIRILDSSNSIAIEANIESIDLFNNNFMILGQTINIDSFTLISDDTNEEFAEFNLNEFSIGDSVFVDITVIDGIYIAYRLSKISPITTEVIIGIIDTIDSNTKTLNIGNNTIYTNSATLYSNQDGEMITDTAFFALLEENVSDVWIETKYIANQDLIATEMTILKNE